MKRYCIFPLETELLYHQVKQKMFSAKYSLVQSKGELASGRTQELGVKEASVGVEGFAVHRVRLKHIQPIHQDHSGVPSLH